MTQVSEDGFWQFENGQWVPTDMQLEALSNGAKPYVEEKGIPIQNQPIHVNQATDDGPYQNTNSQSNQISNNQYSNNFQNNIAPVQNNQILNNQYSNNPVNYDHKSTNTKFVFTTKMKLISGGVIVTLLTTLMILFATLSPGTSSLVDELKDSDGDGITDADEIEMGTDPELRDSDNDDLDDDVDDCPVGDTGWKSTIVTDFDQDGCKDSTEDLDDDNDGINDLDDNCDTSELGWKSNPGDDNDSDGCHDDGDADDDNDGWSDSKEQQCGTNSLSKFSIPSDFDGDMICDIVDTDDDNDGVLDSQDLFPMDSSEWADFDEDGTGDNADLDDDNDGVLDSLDTNDYADTALKLTFDYFTVLLDMDYWDSQSETYICLYLEGENMGCEPSVGGDYWIMETDTKYSLPSSFHLDLSELESSHLIQICAWDKDAFDDDRIDINPESSNNCYNEYVNSGNSIGYTTTITASGVGDGTGYDGELIFSYELIDFRNQFFSNFQWEYSSNTFTLDWSLDYDTYSYYKNLDHTVNSWDDYQYYSTPDAQYIIDLAEELEDMAIGYGYTSDLAKASFILEFVRAIPYQYDIDGMGVSEYPKYPIEMLWEGAGDCEDAAALYISLMEAIDFDAILIILEVKQDADDDTWGGHAMPGIHIPDYSGQGFYGPGDKSNIPFYFAEATGGTSQIGEDSWYDRQNEELYDVE